MVVYVICIFLHLFQVRICQISHIWQHYVGRSIFIVFDTIFGILTEKSWLFPFVLPIVIIHLYITALSVKQNMFYHNLECIRELWMDRVICRVVGCSRDSLAHILILSQLLNLAICHLFVIPSSDLHSVNLPCTTNFPLFKHFKKPQKVIIVPSFPCESAMVSRKPFRRMSFSSCCVVWTGLLGWNRCSCVSVLFWRCAEIQQI